MNREVFALWRGVLEGRSERKTRPFHKGGLFQTTGLLPQEAIHVSGPPSTGARSASGCPLAALRRPAVHSGGSSYCVAGYVSHVESDKACFRVIPSPVERWKPQGTGWGAPWSRSPRGPGDVHRAILQVQRRFFEPPDTHVRSRGKYA